MDMNLSKLQEMGKDRETKDMETSPWGQKRVGYDLATEQQQQVKGTNIL